MHPKTGKVCVPIDPEQAWQFDPEAVPTVQQLVQELGEQQQAAFSPAASAAKVCGGVGGLRVPTVCARATASFILCHQEPRMCSIASQCYPVVVVLCKLAGLTAGNRKALLIDASTSVMLLSCLRVLCRAVPCCAAAPKCG